MHLVERDGELAALLGMLDDRSTGGGSTALISGGIGCGKTELMRRVLSGAEQSGWTVLSAVGTRAERHSPGSVLGQLLRYADVTLEDGSSAAELLEGLVGAGRSAGDGPTPDYDDSALDAAATTALHRLCTAVLQRTEHTPVLVCVDDVQFTDPLSLHWLLHLLHRLPDSRLTVVLAECTLSGPAHPRLHAELLRRADHRRITLGTLSPPGVETLLAEQLGAGPAARLAAGVHAISGGNPLIVRALAEDSRPAVDAAAATDEPTVGDAYGDTVLSCLHSGRPLLLRLAQVLAELDDGTAVAARAARVLEQEPARVERAVRALETAGLTHDGRLRHPVARQAVRDGMSPRRRSDLNRRIAELLYAQGAPATQVARHLSAVEGPVPAWAVPLLREAAERFLAANRAAEAHECVVTALRHCTDDCDRVGLKALLAGTAWLLNPSISARHLGELASALHQGRLPERHALMLAKYLMWHGRFDEAVVALDRIGARAGRLERREAAEIHATRELLSATYPGLVRRAGDTTAAPGRAGAAADPRVRGVAALSRILTHGPDGEAAAAAEAAMRGMQLTKHTQEWLTCAVAALFFADRLEEASTWCDHWLAEARHRNVPLWTAEFASLRAGIAVRRGDLAEARRLAESALALVPAESWGVCLGGPLAHLVHAGTEAGDLAAAAAYLDVPVPEGMFESRFGLYYLHARGRYRLAAGQPHAALGDFLACGDLVRRWHFDQPTLVPWRSEAAHAHLALGDTDRARALAREQLALAGEHPSWARAVSLRAVAAASAWQERPALLTEAVELLEGIGDRVQLAGALADLGLAYGRIRRLGRMRPVLDLAARMAEETGALPLLRTVREAGGTSGRRPYAGQGTAGEACGVLTRLSAAERRVAALAARGHTNREIAEKLTITTSTVEQHLTRVFRKLGVRARKELPAASLL
ncbi:AAA family ATPase [Streptomyces sp. NPDC058807]|uniref:AAA family ATPase n=1 Tax=unclassified Streptomyces TaxID=2593676 RepID=UPI0036A048FC